MKILVVYDVSEEYENVRRRLRETLKDYGGIFLEYSVYMVELDKQGLHALIRDIRRVIRRADARVDILIPCRECLRKLLTFNLTLEKEEEPVI